MRVLILFAAGLAASGQIPPLLPTAEFDLHAGLKPQGSGRFTQSFLTATPSGLLLVTIVEDDVWLTSADLDGRILHRESGLGDVHRQIHDALPRPDGSVWLVSSPSALAEGSSMQWNQLDLYDPAGQPLTSLRVLGSFIPAAASNDRLALFGGDNWHVSASNSRLIHFGAVVDGEFKDRTQVTLSSPVTHAIRVMSANGDLLLIDKGSGTMVVIDPQAKRGFVFPLATPRSIQAAATDSDFVYLLSADTLLKTDLSGNLLSTARFQFSPGFVPASLAVTASSVFLVSKDGRTERFQLN